MGDRTKKKAVIAVTPDKYTLRPTDLGNTKDDFEFRFNGRDVGRTYADTTPNGPRPNRSAPSPPANLISSRVSTTIANAFTGSSI